MPKLKTCHLYPSSAVYSPPGNTPLQTIFWAILQQIFEIFLTFYFFKSSSHFTAFITFHHFSQSTAFHISPHFTAFFHFSPPFAFLTFFHILLSSYTFHFTTTFHISPPFIFHCRLLDVPVFQNRELTQ